jgi:Yip1 domain
MNLVERVRRILTSPEAEWGVIDAEPTTPAALYTSYIAPLAAIGPVARFIGLMVFGISMPFVGTFRPSFGAALTGALLSYVLMLASTYVLALIIDALAPTFSGQRSQLQALKVAAYSSTAAWIAGIFQLIPALSLLTILGVYSLYLLYLGLPRLMRVPRDRAGAYTGAVIVSALVLYLVIAMISGRVTGLPGAFSMP